VVAAVGPSVPAGTIKEGDLVVTYPDCPITNRLWLNKPTGDTSLVCAAIAGNAAGYADADCQLRSCSPFLADTCQWVSRAAGAVQAQDRANYCFLPYTAIRGILNPPTNGTAPKEISRISRPRDKWFSWRREDLNRDLSNGL
jgi:hypothetical protein